MKIKIPDAIKKHEKYFYYAAGAIILMIFGALVYNNKNGEAATIAVNYSDFINQVSVSGKVETSEAADLGFAASGRISRIFVKENDTAREGQILAQLEIADLLADLKIKEINFKTSTASLEDARENVEKVTTQENTKVENAYSKLLSEGLEFIPNSDSYIVEAPTISGLYAGKEGTYKVNIEKEKNTLSELTLLTFNLERTKRKINETGPTPLGTHGLFVSFSEDLDLYHDTIWYLNIPNKASSSYLANYNAYNEAKKARDLAIKDAEFAYRQLLTEESGGVSSVAQAEIDKIRAEIGKNTIYAPFAGIITNIEKEVGETAATNEAVVTMMGEGIFQITSYVPEVNIAPISIGDRAEVTLDAYGESVWFNAKVISVDPAETIRDGISTYRVKLQFDGKDERIKSGMTANVSIIIFDKPNVIVMPGGVVFEREGKNFVQVKNGKEISDREVVLGDVSLLGQVEIISGLAVGEEVVLNPNDK